MILFLLFCGFVNSMEEEKIGEDILTRLNQTESVPVIIELNEEPSFLRMFSTFSLDLEDSKQISSNLVAKTITEKDLKELSENSRVKKISYDHPLVLSMVDSVKIISANTTWTSQVGGINLTGFGQTICVIDTGINYSHPDFGGCTTDEFLNGTCEKVIWGYDYGNGDNDPMDHHGHGSHVSGIVVGNNMTIGVAPESKIVAMKVFSDSGTGLESYVISAIDSCVSHSEEYNISVISLSLGLEDLYGEIIRSNYCDNDYGPLTNSINSAIAKNISVTVATGGKTIGSDSGVGVPACITNVTRVGSSSKLDIISSFTNLGPNFSDILLAPGEGIISTRFNTGGQVSNSGTSMATPMVAGAILLINQYKKIAANQSLNSSFIKNVLNNTGTRLSRTGVGNFSRVNIFSALLSIDEESPELYMSPENGSLVENLNQTLSCNATDIQLSNLTMNIYNSTSLLFNQTVNGTNSLNISMNLYLDFGVNYNFSCEAKDLKNNSIIQTNSLGIDSTLGFFTSPSNNSATNQSLISFNCTSYSGVYDLTNTTFYLSKENLTIYNESLNVTGSLNYSSFLYNVSEEGSYYFYCEILNNNSENFSTGIYLIKYDITSPNIELISPSNEERTTTKNHTFLYNASDNNLQNCTLNVNSNIFSSFTQNLSDGTYYWNITCNDSAGNSNTSNTRILYIYTAESSPSSIPPGGGSVGGGSSSYKTYEVSNSDLESGYEKVIKIGDKLKFTVYNKTHELRLNSVSPTFVSITISNPSIAFILPITQEKTMDFNEDNVGDLKIILINTTITTADIFLKKFDIGLGEEIEEDYNLTLYNETSTGDLHEKGGNFISDYSSYIVAFILVGLAVYFSIRDSLKKKKEKF